MDADRSSTSQAVTSRSAVNSRTIGSPTRAVAFQSMWRASSVSAYSRNPIRSSPGPRWTVR